MQDKIATKLTESDREAVLEAFRTIDGKLPFLASLTADERRHLNKMGEKSVAFVRWAVEMAQDGEDFLPGAFKPEDLKLDLELHDALLPLLFKTIQLKEKLEDTLTLIGSDLFVNSLELYAAAKRHGGGQGLEGLTEVLGHRFDRSSRKPATPPAS
jgi:hypothetical protein